MPWDTMVGVARRSWARNENAMTTVAEYNKMYEGQEDVYKRQGLEFVALLLDLGSMLGILGILLAALSEAADHRGQRGADGAIAVSYTHLDVYKRQGLTMM